MATYDKTLNYYNTNAASFTSDTVSVDFDEKQHLLLKYLQPGAQILDFGCGSGRDSKVFIEKGYQVTAMDGSPEMCKVASHYIGQEVICKKFHELDEQNNYDAIWACASILHVPSIELPKMIEKIGTALKPGGYFYVSFKYGDFEGEQNGRYFTYLTENTFETLLDPFQQLDIVEMSVTADVREGRQHEKWLNVVVKKED
ncbi:SAM-dependent methyltransferase [Lysinibacillus composti]|uniref:Class I SAM-dependent methyltransferase n=1 Tax=Lysinibacillus composti TaxID=720633 RepID=A0A3N9UD11_9BACI|nr:class I SAM-dependent methyltransferase [Lysinibacillus composti]MBM7609127.1 SAM-dependent methyltransferase [Lysinibacillus composti]RQW74187.1 class I SAM-dependent methyltransferase [Lysinibacillus composti]